MILSIKWCLKKIALRKKQANLNLNLDQGLQSKKEKKIKKLKNLKVGKDRVEERLKEEGLRVEADQGIEKIGTDMKINFYKLTYYLKLKVIKFMLKFL